MNALSTVAPAPSERFQAEAQVELDQIERNFASALAKLKPGQPGSDAIREELHHLTLNSLVLIALSRQVPHAGIHSKVRQLDTSRAIYEALRQSTLAHVKALSTVGVAPPVLKLLESWMEVTVETLVLQGQIELSRALESVKDDRALHAPALPRTANPAESLSAHELGQALGGVSDETVRQRERAGELFSVLRVGRKRGREYPAFQAWPGIAGEPLIEVLAALGSSSGATAYGFFTSPTDLLGGLTPIEATLGWMTTIREVDPEALNFLVATPTGRLQAVVKAAEACAAVQAAT